MRVNSYKIKVHSLRTLDFLLRSPKKSDNKVADVQEVSPEEKDPFEAPPGPYKLQPQNQEQRWERIFGNVFMIRDYEDN